MEDLKALREQINEIDLELVELFKMRMEAVYKVAMYKIHNSIEVLDKSREEEIINKHTKDIRDIELKVELEEFLVCLMGISKKAQQRLMEKNME